VGGDERSDFKNPIGRTFLSGSRIFAETGGNKEMFICQKRSDPQTKRA